MPDATTVTVDGVEPSILVKLLDIKDNPDRVRLFTADDGTERYLVKENEEPVLITPADLGALGSVGIEIIGDEKGKFVTKEDDTSAPVSSVQSPVVNPADSGVVKLSPTIGQSSPQV
jgi:hypothetical protein